MPLYPQPRKLSFTLTFLGICVAVFLFSILRGGQVGMLEVDQRFALYGPAVSDGQWWRIFTTVFVHAGLLHIFVNCTAIYNLGNLLESSIGGTKLAAASLICALGAATFVLLFGYDRPTVGASGVICGWLGVMLPIATQAGRRWVGITVLQIAIISLLPFVSWQGHMGGFVFGLLAGGALRFSPRQSPEARNRLLLLAFAVLVAFGLYACKAAAALRGAYSLGSILGGS